jgi:hypothetical protein
VSGPRPEPHTHSQRAMCDWRTTNQRQELLSALLQYATLCKFRSQRSHVKRRGAACLHFAPSCILQSIGRNCFCCCWARRAANFLREHVCVTTSVAIHCELKELLNHSENREVLRATSDPAQNVHISIRARHTFCSRGNFSVLCGCKRNSFCRPYNYIGCMQKSFALGFLTPI